MIHRYLAYLRKEFLETWREWKILVMTVTFAPFFVYLMYGYFLAASPTYSLSVLTHDKTNDSEHELVRAWKRAKRSDGGPVFRVSEIDDKEQGIRQIQNRTVDLLVEVPENFSKNLAAGDSTATLVNHADPANPRANMAMAMSDYYAFLFASEISQIKLPIQFEISQVGNERVLTEFDLYVPALMVLALIMVLFTAAASLIREVDCGTITRLILTPMRALEMLAAISTVQVLLGVASLALAFLAARTVGYQTQASFLLVLFIGGASTLGVIGIGVLVAAFLTSIFELLTVGVFPFFVLMFFSECMFPLPKIDFVTVAGHALYANDLLPTSLTVRILQKVLNHNAGMADIQFEMGVMVLVSAVYFAIGVWLFRRRHLLGRA